MVNAKVKDTYTNCTFLCVPFPCVPVFYFLFFNNTSLNCLQSLAQSSIFLCCNKAEYIVNFCLTLGHALTQPTPYYVGISPKCWHQAKHPLAKSFQNGIFRCSPTSSGGTQVCRNEFPALQKCSPCCACLHVCSEWPSRSPIQTAASILIITTVHPQYIHHF